MIFTYRTGRDSGWRRHRDCLRIRRGLRLLRGLHRGRRPLPRTDDLRRRWPHSRGRRWRDYTINKLKMILKRVQSNPINDPRIMVQFGYWFWFWPVPSQYFFSKTCRSMLQSAYWFNFWSVPTWNHHADLTVHYGIRTKKPDRTRLIAGENWLKIRWNALIYMHIYVLTEQNLP